MATAMVQTDIDINASAEHVWSLLMDFQAYPKWNPFIVQIAGQTVVGTRLRATMKPEGAKAMTFTPTVLEVTPNRAFRWEGHFLFPGLFDGEHRFRLEPLGEGGGVRFVHEESFRGLLVPLFLKQLENSMKAGFHAMNHALKVRAEQGEGG